MINKFKENIRKNALNSDHHAKENKILGKMFKYTFSMFTLIFFLSSVTAIFVYYGFIKKQTPSLPAAIICSFYCGGVIGALIYKNIKLFHNDLKGEPYKFNSLVDDTLHLFLIKTSHKFSIELQSKLASYHSEIIKKEKNKLLLELVKDIDNEVCLIQDEDFSETKKITFLKIIGGFLNIVKIKGLYTEQGPIADDLLDYYKGEKGIGGERGLSERNLGGIFGKANDIFNRAQKIQKLEKKN